MALLDFFCKKVGEAMFYVPLKKTKNNFFGGFRVSQKFYFGYASDPPLLQRNTKV